MSSKNFGDEPVVTIIVPTHNGARHMERLISAIEHQDCGEVFECIIVANACTDETEDVIERAISGDPRCKMFRLFSETRKGKSFALNVGIRLARGDLVTFCDDDCIPDRGWLRAYLQAVRDFPKAILFTGQIRPLFSISPPKWLVHLCDDGLAYGCTRIGKEDGSISLSSIKGANLAAKRHLLKEPYFDEGIFNYRSLNSIGGEDTFFAYTQVPSSNPPVFVSRAMISHTIKETEVGLLAFGRRQIRIGKTIINREMALNGLVMTNTGMAKILQLALKSLFWKIFRNPRRFGIQYRRFCTETGKALQIVRLRRDGSS